MRQQRPGVWDDEGGTIQLPDYRITVEVLERRTVDGREDEFGIATSKVAQAPRVGERIGFKNGAAYEVIEVTWWPEYEWCAEVFVRKVEEATR